MSCSSNRKIAVGSCISTLVSSTNSRRVAGTRVLLRISAPAVPGPGSERLRRFKHFLRVPVHLHLAPLVPQHSCRIEQERTAFDPQILAAVQALFLDDIEQFAELLVLVGQQLEWQPLFVAELVVRAEAVARYADDAHLRLAERAVQVAKVLALARAPGSHVLRIKVDH